MSHSVFTVISSFSFISFFVLDIAGSIVSINFTAEFDGCLYLFSHRFEVLVKWNVESEEARVRLW